MGRSVGRAGEDALEDVASVLRCCLAGGHRADGRYAGGGDGGCGGGTAVAGVPAGETVRNWTLNWSRTGWLPLWASLSRARQRSPLHFGPDRLGADPDPEGRVLRRPFLDIADRVVIQSAFDERGLLDLAFHPRFASNGKLYVQYSAERSGPNICVNEEGLVPEDREGCPLQYTRRVSEFVVSPTDPNRVDRLLSGWFSRPNGPGESTTVAALPRSGWNALRRPR